jgi:hypothetical protein
MRTTVEFRIDERDAREVLPDSAGRILGSGLTRAVKVSTDDPLYALIGRAQVERRRQGLFGFFTSWILRRTYRPEELAAAELLEAYPTAVFEPPGEMTGTSYDETPACPICGAGRVQTTPLTLDLRRMQPGRDIDTQTIPRRKDIARTIAHEVVVSSRLAAILREYAGAALGPVIDARSKQPSPDWFQLGTSGQAVEMVAPTQFGMNPFDFDEAGEYRCPLGHIAGLNVLSELTIARSSWSGADLVATRQLIGRRVGYLVPSPCYLVSQRLYQRLVAEGIKGFTFEVAHLA